MSKKKMIVGLIISNALIIVAFILSSIYIWNFINNTTSQWSYSNDGVTIPIINLNALQVTGGTVGWTNDGTQIPRPLPTIIPNYPFMLFWIAVIGNIIFAVLIQKSKK